MQDEKTPDEKKAGLPGNQGQFGAGDATEDYKKLEDNAAPQDATQGPKQTNAGERS